jgi:hypothetical protein
VRLEITFSDQPTMDEISRLLLSIAEVWPGATVAEKDLLRQDDRGCHVFINCNEN